MSSEHMVGLPPAPIDYLPDVIWDDEEDDVLYLLTIAQFNELPDGTLLVSIHNKTKKKGIDIIDLDTRFGVISWGFRESQLPGKMPFYSAMVI